MATRSVVLNLPGKLVDALDDLARRSGTTTGVLAEQALVQLLLQQGHSDRARVASGDDLEALIRG